jgi:hypothetical protein
MTKQWSARLLCRAFDMLRVLLHGLATANRLTDHAPRDVISQQGGAAFGQERFWIGRPHCQLPINVVEYMELLAGG